jgi:hypothetical protein
VFQAFKVSSIRIGRWAWDHPLGLLLAGAACVSLASFPTHWFTVNEIMHLSDGIIDVPSLAWVHTLANREIHGPFYGLIAWGLLALGCDEEIPFRLFSMAFFLASVGVAYHLARDVLGRGGALVAGAFVATNPFVLLFSHQFVRYDLHLLLGLLATHQLLRTRSHKGWLPALLFGLWVGLGLLNLFTMGFTLLALGAAWFCLGGTVLGRIRPAITGGFACLAVAAIYLPTLLAPPAEHGKPPVDATLLMETLQLVGGARVVLIVAVVIVVRVLVQRVSPWKCLQFASGGRRFLVVHLLLVLVPIATQLLFSVLLMPCTDPWYVLPCVASAAVLFGALWSGSPRVGRALLLAVLAVQTMDSITRYQEEGPMSVDDRTLFEDTTAVLDAMPERSAAVLVDPDWISPGVEFYHHREGRGDLWFPGVDSVLAAPPERLCVLRWERLHREVSVVLSGAPQVLSLYTPDQPLPTHTFDVSLRCYQLQARPSRGDPR